MVAQTLVRKLYTKPDHATRQRAAAASLQDRLSGLFAHSAGTDHPCALTSPKTQLSDDSHLTFEAGSGLKAQVSWPMKQNPSLSPPEYRRRLQIDLISPGTASWFGLEIAVDIGRMIHAENLYWELSGEANADISLSLEIRGYRPGGFDSLALGHAELGNERAVTGRNVALAGSGLSNTGAGNLHIFVPLRAGLSLTLDYLLAHHD